MTPTNRLRQLQVELSTPAKPVGSYVPAVRSGNLIFTAGQIPLQNGSLVAEGKVGDAVSLEDAQNAARVCVLNALAAIAGETGSLDQVCRVIRMNCFVNSADGFTDQAKVANGASDLIADIFGESGKHTRCALGASELPLNAPVELDLIAELSS